MFFGQQIVFSKVMAKNVFFFVSQWPLQKTFLLLTCEKKCFGAAKKSLTFCVDFLARARGVVPGFPLENTG